MDDPNRVEEFTQHVQKGGSLRVLGQRIRDRGLTVESSIAFAEWIVRMHHPDRVEFLDGLFEGAGWRPPWDERHATMIRKCNEVRTYCDLAGWPDAAAWWADRTAVTASWSE